MEPLCRPNACISSSVSSSKPGTSRSIFISLSSWSPGTNTATSLPSAFLPARAFTVLLAGMPRKPASSSMVRTPGVCSFSMAATSCTVGAGRHSPASVLAA